MMQRLGRPLVVILRKPTQLQPSPLVAPGAQTPRPQGGRDVFPLLASTQESQET